MERIREDITRVLAGTLDLRLRLALPADHAQQVTPVVTIEGSVLEVRAHDAPGLLYRLGTAICEADAVITAAKVSTLGSEVVDVFTLVNSVGEPLSDAHAAAVRATVTRALA